MAEIRFITDRDKLSPISEAYRAIRTNLQFAAAGEGQVKTIGFTSALPSEGKSTTVANLAIVIAQDSKRVLLIDCDLRRPIVHRSFGLPNRGLTNCFADGLELTELSVDERARELLSNWASFESDMRGVSDEPEGVLRVIVPHAFGQARLIAPLAQYLLRYPRMQVEWLLHDDRAIQDYIAAGIDCAIQVGEVTDPGLVAIRLSQVPRIVAAAPALLGGAPLPQDPGELAELPWLALRTYYRNEVTLSHADSGKRRRFAIAPRFSTDSLFALRSAMQHGLGVGIASAWVLADDLASGTLVRLAPQWRAAPLPVSLVYPYARFYPARLRRFAELIREGAPAIFGDVTGG